MKQLIKVTILSLFIFFTGNSSITAVEDKNAIQKELNMTDKTTLIVTSTPNLNEQETLKKYVTAVMPLLLNLGGTVVKRSKVTDTYYGKNNFIFLLVMDFPSKQALTDMFNSDTYKDLIPIREKGFESINILFSDNLE